MTATPLTERIAAAIGGHWPITALPNGTVLCHCGDRVKADRQRQAFREHTAAAVLAVVQPELDQLRTERDQACVRVDVLAATARGDRAARRVSIEECTRLTTELDRANARVARLQAWLVDVHETCDDIEAELIGIAVPDNTAYGDAITRIRNAAGFRPDPTVSPSA